MTKAKEIKEVKSDFIAKVIAGLNKTEAQKQVELTEKFQAYGIIDCERQISILESEIKERNTDVSLEKKQLVLAEKEVNSATYSIADNYEAWVIKQNRAEMQVQAHKNSITSLESKVLKLQAELAKHQKNLSILQS
jgi:hypothetical protein